MKAKYPHSLFHQKVSELAYYLFVLRGCKEGNDFNNWIEAEARLKQQMAMSDTGHVKINLEHR